MFDSLKLFLAQAVDLLPEGAEEAPKEAAKPGAMSFLLPMMLALLVMMLLMRPRKGDQRQRQQLADMKKNDRVVTAGGIIGTVLSIREDTNSVTLRIDESTNAKMQVLRTSIVRILSDEKPAKEEKK